MIKLHHTKYVKDNFICPITGEKISLPVNKWESYIKSITKDQSAESLSVIYINETNPRIKKILEDIIINMHNSVEQ